MTLKQGTLSGYSRNELQLPGAVRARWVLLFMALSLAAPLACPATAQSSKDPLTNDQVEQVRDTGAEPGQRIKLYMKFIEQRTAEIHKVAGNARAQTPGAQIHNLMEEFTRLTDELQDNLETYSETHADMRKTLKELVEQSNKWNAALHEPKASQDYDFARKTAIDTAQSATDLGKKLLEQQEKYFAAHKGQK